jgi:hypothetical protein
VALLMLQLRVQYRHARFSLFGDCIMVEFGGDCKRDVKSSDSCFGCHEYISTVEILPEQVC